MTKAHKRTRKVRTAQELYAARAKVLSLDLANQLFYYDGEDLFWRVDYKKQMAGREVGNRTNGHYRQLKFKGVPFQVTHIIHFMEKGVFPGPGLSIDHADGNPANDRAANLRPATAKQQGQNRKVGLNAEGLPNGSVRDELGNIWVPGMLGPFETNEAAVKGKVDNQIKRFGNFARTMHGLRRAIAGKLGRITPRLVTPRRIGHLNSTQKRNFPARSGTGEIRSRSIIGMMRSTLR